MLLLSDLDILFLKVLFASSVAYSVNLAASQLNRKPTTPSLIPEKKTTQKSGTHVTATRSIKQKLELTQKQCVIFYGSQTGTSEKLAAILAKEALAKFGLDCLVANLEDFDYDDLLSLPEDKMAIFLLATYGEGEPTDNAIAFDRYCNVLGESVDVAATSLRYAAFGLGSSSYTQFNAMIRRVDSALNRAGATRIGDLGAGDDGKGTLEDDFLSWKDDTLPLLAQRLGLSERENKFVSTFRIEATGAPSADTFLGEPNKAQLRGKIRGPYSALNPLPAPIAYAKQVFTGGDRKCLHMEFDVQNTTLTYESGDHLAIWPSNTDIEVARFLEVFGLKENKAAQIEIQSDDLTVKIPLPTNTTYEAAARYYLEICAPVTRHMLTLLTEFAVDEQVRSRLVRLTTDHEALQKDVKSPHLNLAQLLQSLSPSWSQVPFSFLLENMRKLQPRYYSISSSSLASKKSITITAVVDSRKQIDWTHEFNGVATSYLLSLALKHNPVLLENQEQKIGQLVDTHTLSGPRGIFTQPTSLIHVRRSKFHLPSDSDTPVIMIGPGTGVAPFRAFTQERAFQSRNGKRVGRTVLFYGCRRRDEDFLYENEWMVNLFPFSRIGNRANLCFRRN
jgi:NADPH-ferrihemoprotein reductase